MFSKNDIETLLSESNSNSSLEKVRSISKESISMSRNYEHETLKYLTAKIEIQTSLSDPNGPRLPPLDYEDLNGVSDRLLRRLLGQNGEGKTCTIETHCYEVSTGNGGVKVKCFKFRLCTRD